MLIHNYHILQQKKGSQTQMPQMIKTLHPTIPYMMMCFNNLIPLKLVL